MQHTSLPGVSRSTSSNGGVGLRRNGSDKSSDYVTVSSGWLTRRSSAGGSDRSSMAWSDVRHEVGDELGPQHELQVVKERSPEKCTQAVLITCLHLSHAMVMREVGLYAWCLPHVKDPHGSMMRIVKQYAHQLRTIGSPDLRCRSAPDPSKASIQHHLQKARMSCGTDNYMAVLYSGHGIQEPPTEAGELWCYDISFEEAVQSGRGPSEYIPIMLFDYLTWAGAATCHVWDCEHAGRLIKSAITEAEEIDTQLRGAAQHTPSVADLHPPIYAKKQIHFAACGANQTLPRVPGMPDDLFTACLTTPLRIALLYHNLQTFPLTASEAGKSVQKHGAYMDALWTHMSDHLKRRLWTELEAIMHTIAWQSLEGTEYQMVFGQSGDLVSSMAGGFLLSQRVMGTYRANPESIPTIPSSTSHALWTHWDLILDNFFEQLPSFSHFEERPEDTTWESKLILVSFMADQLESILQTEYPLSSTGAPKRHGNTPGLTRLPIICRAVLTDEFRQRACTALDSCLTSLDHRGLVKAVQGGALDVAIQLLGVQDEDIASSLISIWASLVRNDSCVKSLGAEGRSAKRLTSVPSVQFFLNALEKHIERQDSQSVVIVIETAVVLATLANFVEGRKAPRFCTGTLSVASKMLESGDYLVTQWGILLVAEVTGSIDQATEVDKPIIDRLHAQLVKLTSSPSVEARATAVYALSRYILCENVKSLIDLAPQLDIAKEMIDRAEIEGSALVRRELVNYFHRVIHVGGKWSSFALIMALLEDAADALPDKAQDCIDFAVSAGPVVGIREGKGLREALRGLVDVVKALNSFRFDPHIRISQDVDMKLAVQLDHLKPYLDGHQWEGLLSIALCSCNGADMYTSERVDALLVTGKALMAEWGGITPTDGDILAEKLSFDHSLFEKSKETLQVYLEKKEVFFNTPHIKTGIKDATVQDATPPRIPFDHALAERSKDASQPTAEKAEPGSTMPLSVQERFNHEYERTYILRERFIEDSLVIADQQKNFPWKWAMKDIVSPQPWSNITFHSFLNLMMARDDTKRIRLWDWSTEKEEKVKEPPIPDDCHIKSVRFVNELQERILIVAEIDNGSFHVLASSCDDPGNMHTISSIRALDITSSPTRIRYASHKKLVTTWFRHTGIMCVGGPAPVIKVWDCPAERCERSFETMSEEAVTSLITEPISGDFPIAGFADGTVKLFDLRVPRRTALLSWKAESRTCTRTQFDEAILRVGVTLGESKYIMSASANGILNTHDIRNLTSPTSSVLAHDNGTAAAAFQTQSGLMSTVSNLNPVFDGAQIYSEQVSPTASTHSGSSISSTVNSKPLSPEMLSQLVDRPKCNFGLFRSTESAINSVTEEQIIFKYQDESVTKANFKPFTHIHSLRPFLGIGYGTTTYLRGSGTGRGDNTDSGSHSFLRAQAKLVL